METLINDRTGRIIGRAKICSTLLSQARGLMFSKKKDLLFDFKKEKKIGLHMLFVFFPITVVYLNSPRKVLFTKKLYPFISYCRPPVPARYVIELVNDADLKTGDEIKW